MTKEQMRELFDLFLTIPKSENTYIKFEVDNSDGDVQVFVKGTKVCECCGQSVDESELKISDDYNVVKKFIEKWKEIIEKESKND